MSDSEPDWNEWKEKEKLSTDIAKQLEGNTDVLTAVLRKLAIGCVTGYIVVKEDDLICDPIIWTVEDLEDCTPEEWFNTRAYKTLNERSIEEGHFIKQILEAMVLR